MRELMNKSGLVCLAVTAMLACGSSGEETQVLGIVTEISENEKPSDAQYCRQKCVEHETACGDPDANASCENICSKYKPLIWQVDCANEASCGDQDLLKKCMPDLDCQSQCEKHEKDCGAAEAETACTKICNTWRPTPSQVDCAEGVSCGDNEDLVACVKAP